jgi:TetR/AcrR family transcriptional regulator, transcriptional repressor for nem operon
METTMNPQTEKYDTKIRLLDAALSIIREQGYAATSVDSLCSAAQVSKGAFFHHFRSKEELAVAAAEYWSQTTGALFANAPYHVHSDPLERVLGYIDFRQAILKGGVPEFTCLVGTMVQEAYDTSPAIREACNACITDHADKIAADIAAAMERYGIDAEWTAESLAMHTQAVLQGAFILAKARGGPEIAVESVAHLRRYIEMLFGKTAQ